MGEWREEDDLDLTSEDVSQMWDEGQPVEIDNAPRSVRMVPMSISTVTVVSNVTGVETRPLLPGGITALHPSRTPAAV